MRIDLIFYCFVITDPPPRDTASGTDSLHGLLLLSKRRIKKFWLHDIVYPSGVQTLSDRGFLIAQANKTSTIGGSRGASGTRASSRSNFCQFYAVFGKNLAK